jgi:hypothetical protein
MKTFLKILIARLKSYGTLNLCIMKKAQVGRIVGKAIKRFLKSPTKTTVARGTSEGIQKSKKPKAQYGIETNLNKFNQMGMKSGGNVKKKMQYGGTAKKASKVTVDKPYERGIMGQGNSATKTSSTMSGGTKTKKVSTGAVFPGAKGSVTKTKTDSKGNMIKTSNKTVSKSKAGKMINRMSK